MASSLNHPKPLPIHRGDDQSLIAAIRAGNEAAFKQLFDTHWRSLCVFAERCLQSRDTAQDIVQSVFARVWEERERWQVHSNIKAYLFAAVRTRVIAHVRHAQVEDRLAINTPEHEIPPGMAEATESPDRQLDSAIVSASIHQAIAALPPRTRLVASMRWLEQLSQAEIAAALGVSRATVNNQITYAVKAMRERLKANGYSGWG